MTDREGQDEHRPRRSASTASPTWAVIVLTGGASTRMGTRKDVLELDGVPVVARLLEDLPPHVPVVVVGLAPPETRWRQPRSDDHGATSAAVVVTREDPPGGGPVAGIAAGLALVTTPLVAIAAGDMPYAGALIAALARQYLATDQLEAQQAGDVPAGPRSGTVADRVEALLPVDAKDQPQPLCAVYDAAALRRAVDALGSPAGRSVRQLVGLLRVQTTAVGDDSALLDIDTPADLARARARLQQPSGDPAIMAIPRSAGRAMKQWIDAVKQELGLDIDIDVAQILDVAKDAAHSVERPAAPVTTYLLGYAIAAGADPGETAGIIRRLATTWSAPE